MGDREKGKSVTRTMKVNAISAETPDEEYELQHPWPEDAHVQGGHTGVVIVRGGDNYRTAFFEAFPSGTFIRGEGESLSLAEDACWVQFERYNGCPEHVWRPYPRGREDSPYKNGAGFCQLCNRFESNRFTGAELGQFCVVCGEGTTWDKYGPEAYLDPDGGFFEVKDPSLKESKVWYCEADSPFRAEILENRARRSRELDEAFERMKNERSS